MQGHMIDTITIDNWTSLEIAASGNDTEDIELYKYRPEGFASLQITITGSGTAKITHLSSNDGTTFNTFDGATDIVTAMTAGSAIYQFDLPFAKYLRLKIEETGGANSITITKAVLAIQ